MGAVAAVVIGAATSAGLVWNASYSAFSAQTTTPTNNWTAGTVALTNGQTGSALWTVTNFKPGYAEIKCITVTSTGNLPSLVKMYRTPGSYSATQGLGPNMSITVEQGSGTSGGSSCTAFTLDSSNGFVSGSLLSFYGTNYTSYSNGPGTWTTTGSGTETKVFRIRIQFNAGAVGSQAELDALQGATGSIGFTWEAQNT